jgi:hypothetical protein
VFCKCPFLDIYQFRFVLFQMIQKEMCAKAEKTQESASESEDNGETSDGEEDSVSEGSGDDSSNGNQDG